MATIRVRNLITSNVSIYVNDKGLSENIVNEIILQNNQSSNLLDESFRDKYRNLVEENTSTITGRKFAFCEQYDLHASYVVG